MCFSNHCYFSLTVVTKVDKYVIQKVLELRKEKGISQSQLAFEIGYSSKSYIQKIESGKYDKKYNVAQLNEIAKALGCSPKDFLPQEPM
ncbi:MAG: helix-turn-helix transcriptional regulator [Flavipsychrobacter sp.]